MTTAPVSGTHVAVRRDPIGQLERRAPDLFALLHVPHLEGHATEDVGVVTSWGRREYLARHVEKIYDDVGDGRAIGPSPS